MTTTVSRSLPPSVRAATIVTFVAAAALLLMLAPPAGAATTGPAFPIGNSNGVSNWASPNDAKNSDDTCSSTTRIHNRLAVRGFGFTIPADATITGIQVDVEYAALASPSSRPTPAITSEVQLFKTVSSNLPGVVGDPKDLMAAAGATNCATAAPRTLGGDGDLWGTAWTPAELNATNFGVRVLAVTADNINRGVDSVTVTVYYTLPPDIVSSGPMFPTGSSTGISNWASPNSGRTGDNVCANTNKSGNTLALRGFGVSIPATAVITGIEVRIEYAAGVGDPTVTAEVQLFKTVAGSATNGTLVGAIGIVGNPKNLTAEAGVTTCNDATVRALGGDGDLWGTTWTPDDVNAANFGVRISAAGGTLSHLVDSVSVVVYYLP